MPNRIKILLFILICLTFCSVACLDSYVSQDPDSRSIAPENQARPTSSPASFQPMTDDQPATATSGQSETFNRPNHPDQLSYQPLKVIIPRAERHELSNKIILYVLEDHELPLIDIIARFRIGSIYDPPDKLGLANLTALLIRNGGSTSLTAAQLDEELENMAASLSVFTDYEEITFRMSLLKEDLIRGLEILSEILQRPVFDAKKIEFEKSQLQEQLRRENDNPGIIASREFKKLIYPAHPYGQRVAGDPATLESITREDIIKFHKEYFTPDNLFLGVSGDFKTDELIKLITQTTQGWMVRGKPLPRPEPLKREYKKSVNLISKKINQASIMVGHIGVNRTTKDFFPLRMMNGILGRGYVSRLYQRLREREGLVYGVWGYFTMPNDLGMFIVEFKTKNASTAKALKIVKEELKKIRAEPVADKELEGTKEAIINQFVFKFTNPDQIVNIYIYIELLGLPSNYLETYREQVLNVTKEDIQRVAQEYIKPDDLIYLVVGDEKNFDAPLSEFGPVNRIQVGK